MNSKRPGHGSAVLWVLCFFPQVRHKPLVDTFFSLYYLKKYIHEYYIKTSGLRKRLYLIKQTESDTVFDKQTESIEYSFIFTCFSQSVFQVMITRTTVWTNVPINMPVQTPYYTDRCENQRTWKIGECVRWKNDGDDYLYLHVHQVTKHNTNWNAN